MSPAVSDTRQRRLPSSASARLRAGLAREHRRRPFGPDDVRGAARRALAVAEEVGLRGHIARGGLDLGGAELDHVWAVVEAHVVDVTLPVLSRDFVGLLRGYVAGDNTRMTSWMRRLGATSSAESSDVTFDLATDLAPLPDGFRREVEQLHQAAREQGVSLRAP